MPAKCFYVYNIKVMEENNTDLKLSEVKKVKKESFWWEIIKTILVVGLIVFVVRFYIIQPYYIIGSSMEPDYHNGEYLFIDEASYHFTQPKRGDVIVFKHPDEACTAFVEGSPILKTFLQGPCKNYIKRVIGLPGETVKIADGKVIIVNKEHPNGFTLKESYIAPGVQTLGDQTFTVGKDEYFVLGDNRKPNASSDSRDWGLLSKNYIVGRALIKLLPVNEAGIFKSPSY